MKTLAAALLAACVALAACGPKPEASGGDGGGTPGLMSRDAVAPAPEMAAPPAEAPAMADGPADEKQVAPGPSPVSGTPPGAPMLAYTYMDGLELPAKNVSAVMKAHQKICSDAGAANCQVLGASTASEGEDDVSAQLSLRGEPHWLQKFRAQLESDASKAGGKIVSTRVDSEDLTRQIVDTTANLGAQKTLRDRLQKLLASRPGKLSELLEVERELARVQGEVDATESNLAVMKARVAMSQLTISYASAGKPLTDRTFEPIADAVKGFMRIVAMGIAAIITLIAAVLPFVPLVLGGVWLFRWWRRKTSAKAAAVAPPPSPPAST